MRKGNETYRKRQQRLRQYRLRHRQRRRAFESKILSHRCAETSSDNKSDAPNLFDMSIMVQVCRRSWSQWLEQVSVARMHQVAVLTKAPSIENIELMQSLETLGVQIETVSDLRLAYCTPQILSTVFFSWDSHLCRTRFPP